MGIYDRDYVRGDEPTGWQVGGAAHSIAIQLIAVNVVAWIVCALGGDNVTSLFALHADSIYKPWMWWQFVTYAFVHDTTSLRHLGFNMLGLFFFGREIEAIYGRRAFLRLYLAAAVAGSIVWAARLAISSSGSPEVLTQFSLVGASGAVAAIVILFCLKLPQRIILLMFVLPVPAWILGILLIASDIWGASASRGTGVAFDVHLVGAAVAFGYFRYGHLLGWSQPGAYSSSSSGRRRSSDRQGGWGWLSWLKPKPKLKIHSPEARAESEMEYDELDDRGDEILLKRQREGEEGLTAKERELLAAYSRRMRQKHR